MALAAHTEIHCIETWFKIRHLILILYLEFKYKIKFILRLKILTQGQGLHFKGSENNKGREELLLTGKMK